MWNIWCVLLFLNCFDISKCKDCAEKELYNIIMDTKNSMETMNIELRKLQNEVKVKDIIIERLEEMLTKTAHGVLELTNHMHEKDRQTEVLLKDINDRDLRVSALEEGIDKILHIINAEILSRRLYYPVDNRRDSIQSIKEAHTSKENTTETINLTDNTRTSLVKSKQRFRFKAKLSAPEKNSNLSERGFFQPRNRRADAESQVAFYAYMSHTEKTPGPHHILVFDHVITNEGQQYNKYNGMFTAPASGVYAFSYTIYVGCRLYVRTEIVVNDNIVGSSEANDDEDCDIRTSTGNAIVKLNLGDVVFIRTQQLAGDGNVLSDSLRRSTFSGFEIA